MNEPKLVYGLRNGVPVHISEVERGLRCNCICPECKMALVAKKGPRRLKTDHFAHASGAECAASVETGLHLASKDILAKRREIWLPVAEVRFPGGKSPIEVTPEGVYAVSNVRLETGIGGLIPDVLAEINGQPLAIEIFVTHRVDDEKTRRFRQLGLSVVEIDLSRITRDMDPVQLESLVIDGRNQKRWLFHTEVANREKVAWAQAARLTTVTRGGALHVDGCPIPMREYKGRPYANVIDDCIGCPHHLGSNHLDQGVVACDANLGLCPAAQETRTLVRITNNPVVKLSVEEELVGPVEVDRVMKSRDGLIFIEGYNLKQRSRQSYCSNVVKEVLEMESGEIRETTKWLRELTRSASLTRQ